MLRSFYCFWYVTSYLRYVAVCQYLHNISSPCAVVQLSRCLVSRERLSSRRPSRPALWPRLVKRACYHNASLVMPIVHATYKELHIFEPDNDYSKAELIVSKPQLRFVFIILSLCKNSCRRQVISSFAFFTKRRSRV